MSVAIHIEKASAAQRISKCISRAFLASEFPQTYELDRI
jgi:hypothetical protein